jgi:hypothetical protein
MLVVAEHRTLHRDPPHQQPPSSIQHLVAIPVDAWNDVLLALREREQQQVLDLLLLRGLRVHSVITNRGQSTRCY